jgi:protease-4
VLLAVLLACCGCVFMGFVMLVGAAGSAATGGGLGTSPLIEQTVSGSGADKIALVEINGMIARTQAAGLFGPAGGDMVQRIKQELEQAAEDGAVKCVLLSIDSPGGTVTASDQIWHAIQDFKQRTNKPVVVHMGAVCASGGVYIAVSGDKIVCEPTTITGSIGVVLSTMNFSGLLKEYGVQDVTITSGPNKDLLNSTAPVRDEHLEIMRVMIMESYDRFTQLVADGRQLDVATVREFADGRIYTPSQALDLKLVDLIGYREDALAECEKLAGVLSSKLVRYARPPSLADVLAGNVRSGAVPGVQLDADIFDRLGSPRLLALWRAR